MKTRFCPSPTGHIHIGNARTALFSALAARSQQGVFLVRIEDTDQARSQTQYTDQLLADLRWLGLQWDEGPLVGGNLGPYWQSQRQAIYDQYYERLITQQLAYPCFCTPEQLAINRSVQLSRGQPPRYAGTCRKLSVQEVESKLAQGLKPTLRFRVPLKQTIQFHDLVKGRQRFTSDDLGDFIIRRADLTAPFLFCNAIDDSLMGITHVLRGDDHVPNTPRQLLLLQALNLPTPEYGHISMIVGPDSKVLSKRHGSRSIKELREMGYLAGGVVNYLARLGHYYAENHYASLEELARGFSIEHLGKAPARYDAGQLDYWQKEALMHLEPAQLWDWLSPAVQGLVPSDKEMAFAEAVRSNILFPDEAEKWARLFFGNELPITSVETALLREAGQTFFQQAVEIFQQCSFNFKDICQAFESKLKIRGKALYQPLRIALTSQLHGPELGKIIALIGYTQVVKRLERAATIAAG